MKNWMWIVVLVAALGACRLVQPPSHRLSPCSNRPRFSRLVFMSLRRGNPRCELDYWTTSRCGIAAVPSSDAQARRR